MDRDRAITGSVHVDVVVPWRERRRRNHAVGLCSARHSLDRVPVGPDAELPEGAVWIDLVTPDPQEDKLVERHVGIAVPTREEMQEIEVTSRLYVENGARYMTATLMCQSDTDTPKTTPVTFILVRTSARHGALRRAAPVHARRQQARPRLPGRRVTAKSC